jgi:ATP-binding cassette subfamily F protein 3
VASGSNFLLFDEPTNHLDVESREALEAALEAFPGTVLLVSHDRALLDAIADRTLALEDGTIRSYDGGWADYVARRDEREAAATEPEAPKPKKEKPKRVEPRRPSELEQLEAEIAARESAIAELERKLADDWSDVDTVNAHRRQRDELQELLARWENLFERSQA